MLKFCALLRIVDAVETSLPDKEEIDFAELTAILAVFSALLVALLILLTVGSKVDNSLLVIFKLFKAFEVVIFADKLTALVEFFKID